MSRLKVKELIAKAHACVGDLPPAQHQVMTEVITRLDTVYVALTESIELRAAVVAENAQMLRLLTDISEYHEEYVNADEYLYAGVPMDYVSEINAYVSRDVDAENPFKATDAFLAEVRSQAITDYSSKRGFSFQHGSIHAHFGSGDVMVGATKFENGHAGICFAPVREKDGGVGTEYKWTEGKNTEEVDAVFVISSSSAEGLEVIQNKLAEAIESYAAQLRQGAEHE